MHFQPITQSLILKSALTSGFAFEALSAHNVYNKEIEFYGKIVPFIQILLETLNESNGMVADTIGVCPSNKAIIFEDLSSKGYALASIETGFNLIEAKEVLEKLATFHGICAVLQEKRPDIFANFKYGKKIMMDLIKSCFLPCFFRFFIF